MTNKTLDIYKKIINDKTYKLTEEEKSSVDLLDTSLSSDGRFKLYQQVFDKNYQTKKEESAAKVYLNKSLIQINKVNSADLPYKLGLTQFSDLSPEQMKEYYGILILDESTDSSKDKLTTNIADDDTSLEGSDDPSKFIIDYDAKGMMNPVQNQLQCGGCWAFSAIAAFEGKIAKDKNLTGKDIPKYSEQQLISCSKENSGCNGGLPESAFDFLKKTDAVLLENYKYTSGPTNISGQCKDIKAKKKALVKEHIPIGKSYRNILNIATAADEYAMAESLYKNGPLSIGIAVGSDTPNFMLYKSGIYTGGESHKGGLSHAVVIVGLVKAKDVPGVGSDTKDIKYAWKVRNSWGSTTKWGDKGHFYMAYGKNILLCAILPRAITKIDVDIPAKTKPTPGPTPKPRPKPKPTPKPGPTPKPTPKPGPTPKPRPTPIPGPGPAPGPSKVDYKKYYTNPKDTCLEHELTFDNNTYRVCTTKARAQPGTTGLAADIKLTEYCPGSEVKSNIRPLFFVQGTISDKYCAVACNNNNDCLNGAICKQVMHEQSSLQVCVFQK